MDIKTQAITAYNISLFQLFNYQIVQLQTINAKRLQTKTVLNDFIINYHFSVI